MLNRLSQKKVESLRKIKGRHADGGNLYLEVRKPPAASWVFRFEVAEKEHSMGLGSLDLYSLADARERARPLRLLLADGKDPLATAIAERRAKAVVATKALTFEECAAQWYRQHENRWRNAKVRASVMSALKRYVFPIIGKMPVGAIDVGHILRVMEQSVDDRGSFWTARCETASKVRGYIAEILDWAKVRKLRSGDNPAAWSGNLKQALPAASTVAPVQNIPALPYADLPAFMQDLRARPALPARALEFTILTAARTNETLGAKWAEIDLERAVWTVPGERMKMGREHRVPLSKQAVALLRALPREKGNPYLFIGTATGKPLGKMAMLIMLKDRMGRTDITVHGFRSTFRDFAEEQTNHGGNIAEAALAHLVGDKVEAAYRRGDLFEKRRRLMNQWATFACTPAKPANVITLEKRSA